MANLPSQEEEIFRGKSFKIPVSVEQTKEVIQAAILSSSRPEIIKVIVFLGLWKVGNSKG